MGVGGRVAICAKWLRAHKSSAPGVLHRLQERFHLFHIQAFLVCSLTSFLLTAPYWQLFSFFFFFRSHSASVADPAGRGLVVAQQAAAGVRKYAAAEVRGCVTAIARCAALARADGRAAGTVWKADCWVSDPPHPTQWCVQLFFQCFRILCVGWLSVSRVCTIYDFRSFCATFCIESFRPEWCFSTIPGVALTFEKLRIANAQHGKNCVNSPAAKATINTDLPKIDKHENTNV